MLEGSSFSEALDPTRALSSRTALTAFLEAPSCNIEFVTCTSAQRELCSALQPGNCGTAQAMPLAGSAQESGAGSGSTRSSTPATSCSFLFCSYHEQQLSAWLHALCPGSPESRPNADGKERIHGTQGAESSFSGLCTLNATLGG